MSLDCGTYLVLHPGHSIKTIPRSYALLVNWCVDRVLQFAAVHVKVKDSRGSFVSDLAVWGSEVTVDGAEAEGTSLELCRTVEGRRNRDKESRLGGGRRSRKLRG
jgi:hypothetical protein